MVRRLFHLVLLPLALMGGARPGAAQDAAELVVRLGRLEGQVRQLSGQIEQLQFENRQLKEQVRKFQEDVEFRFQERAGGATRAPAPPQAQPSTPSQQPGTPTPPRPARRSDAFDPTASPDAPGSPRPLGTTPPSAALPAEPRMAAVEKAPPGAGPAMDGSSRETPRRDGIGALIEDEEEDGPGTQPLDLDAMRRAGSASAVPPGPPPAAAARAGPSIAATGTGDPRTDYDAAYAYLLQKQYEQAEMGFRQFLQSHPRDRLVPDATFWLGESYLLRNRMREAAEQFLKVSTEYARSTKAPDAMLKLGISLNALGAREQACATLAELERKFPQASAGVRQGVEREQKRARCAA
jgi:tol-pal system protein YbgF